MVKVNEDHSSISEEDKKLRLKFRTMQPEGPERDIYYYEVYNSKIRFSIKKPEYDPKGAVDGFWPEDDMRSRFFYPFLLQERGHPMVFIDVGCCHGSWTLPALAAGAVVTGFEPDPRYHPSLRDSININPGFVKRIQLLSVGLYSKNGVSDMGIFGLEDVTVIKFDEYVEQSHIWPDFIKIDVEGVELEVLAGMKQTLKRLKPTIFLELHWVENKTGEEKPDREKGLLDIMSEVNYDAKKAREEEFFSYWYLTPK